MQLFDINYTKDENDTTTHVELQCSSTKTHAKIALHLGASLQELSINNKNIIEKIADTDYKVNYASAILFPFANRVKDGTYTFNTKEFQLHTNEEKTKNAIHGLVYNKHFEIIEKEVRENHATISLFYKEVEKPKGFPFNYSITLTYTLTNSNLELKIAVKNIDNMSFPFNIGWHPYFSSSNLHKSYLKFESKEKFIVDARMIPVKTEKTALKDSLHIKGSHFDDCFSLNNNVVNFKTPDYEIELNTSYKENYLQLYTPENRKHIAIEPSTAPPDSFNNNRGLQILAPEETYTIDWSINLKNDA